MNESVVAGAQSMETANELTVGRYGAAASRRRIGKDYLALIQELIAFIFAA